ncbi:MAG: hypothetical protein IPQ07_27585 [Myxococcales bacterium]|nr:hypothetical protein [Myxococcales bacterium]
MADVLWVIPRTSFEREQLGLGEIWRSARRPAGARPADTLYLVTARPAGKLWLVAVLAGKRRNQAPIVEINKIVPKLRLARGKTTVKALRAARGSRVLADARALAAFAAPDAPVSPVAAGARSPALERQARSRARWPVTGGARRGTRARRGVSQASGDGGARAGEADRRATGGDPGPRRVADACLAADPTWAIAPFTDARELERTLELPISLARYATFAARGALDERELLHLAATSGSAPILIDAVVHGVAATIELVDELRANDATRARDVLRGWLGAGLLATIDLEVWQAAGPLLGELLAGDAGARATALTTLAGRDDVAALLLLAELDLAAGAPPALAAQLGELALRLANKAVTAESLAAAGKVLATIRGVVDRPLAIVEQDAWSPVASRLLDPAVLEVALAHGIALTEPPGAPDAYTFNLYAWASRDLAEDHLRRLGAHPWLRAALAGTFAPRHGRQVGAWLRRALAADGCGCVLEALDHWAAVIGSRWTLGALEVHGAWLEAVCLPDVLERVPALADAIRGLDPARLLGNQLRAGIMDEWGWPAYDEALARFADPRDAKVWGGPIPYLALFGEGKLVVVGPDRIVLDRPYAHPSGQASLRRVYWVGGEALACSWGPELGHWVDSDGELFDSSGGLSGLGEDGVAIDATDRWFRRGDRALPHRSDGRGAGRRVWFDGSHYFNVTQECVLRRDGTPWRGDRAPGTELYTFEPATGATTGHALPAWMAGLLETDADVLIVHIEVTELRAVPPGAELSPLGARDGFGGFAVYTRQGLVHSKAVDGRRGPGFVNGLHVAQLMTFPERDELYPVVQSAFDHGITLPDGTTPLIPADKLDGPEYWGGTVGLDLPYFWQLRPRDPAASRALAACKDDAARALVAAAAPTPTRPEHVTDYGNMQAVLVEAAADTSAPEALRAAIARVLPEVTHPRMVAGVAALAMVAAKFEATCVRLRGQVTASAPGRRSSLTNLGGKAIATLFSHDMHWWIEQLGTQLGQQILDVSSFLFGDHPGPVTPARTVLPWELVMPRLGELLYRLVAPGTPRSTRAELVRVLELWSTTELAAHPERVRLVSFAMPPCAELVGLDREHPDRLLVWTNRYFVRFAAIEHGHVVVRAVEATRDGTFRLPPGAQLVEERWPDRRFSCDTIVRALALLAERGPVSFAPIAVARVAAETGLGAPAATLLWAAGYEPWLAGTAVQRALGMTREQLALAELELRDKRLRELYADAMPEDPEVLYGVGGAERLAAAWTTRFGRTTGLPTELVAALRADLSDPTLPLERDARLLLDPEASPILTRDVVWALRPAVAFDAGRRRFHGELPAAWPVPASAPDDDRKPDRDDQFHGYAMSRFVPYLAWAQLALPGGDPARRGAARVGELIRARLANPELLVLAALLDLTDYDNSAFKTTPRPDASAVFAMMRERFGSIPYVSPDGRPVALGVDRGDAVVTWPSEQNGLVIAFRPHRLADDASLLRFLDDLGAGDAYRRTQGAVPIAVDVAGAQVICPSCFGHWLTWRAPGFQRLVDALAAPLPTGRFAADPRVSAPDAVARVRAAHDLDEAAATLRLQELVLADASPARVTRYNAWSATELARARRTLDTRALPAPAPRALHGLGSADETVFRVLLPLRPLGELFALAADDRG